MARKVLGRAVIPVAVALGLAEVVALGARISAAGEAGQHAAGLKSEETECKYVLDLCARSKRCDATFVSAKKDLERDSSVENIDRYRDAFIDSHVAFTELSEAAKVIVRKHGKSPNCFQQCSGIIDERKVSNLP
jgi:hypothetical protein